MIGQVVELSNGKKGKIVDYFPDGGYAVSLIRKKEKNYKHHKTEYVVYAKDV